jgi:glycosyltransferase involved in cell wall biosynthesis
MSTILFYDDVSVFGGHQVTAVDAVRFLLKKTNFDVGFMACRNNFRLIESLNTLNSNSPDKQISIWLIDEASSIKSLITNPFLLLASLKTLAKQIRSINPALLVAVQGNVYISFLGILAAKQCGVKTVSFIPMGIQRDRVSIKSRLMEELITRFIYSLPDTFITIAQSAKEKLINNGVKHEIEVIYCGIDTEKLIRHERSSARNDYGMKPTDYAMAVIGRIQFCHKAQDFLVQSLLDCPELPDNLRLYIVGDGPDAEELARIVELQDRKKIVTILPWDNDLTKIYSAIDMLLIPSWHEGLPLVMLEAMHYGIPIVASNVDGMAEILPEQWLFKCGDSQDLIERVTNVIKMNNAITILKNENATKKKYNLHSFGSDFHEHIKHLIS